MIILLQINKRYVDAEVKRGNIQLLSLRTIFDKFIANRNDKDTDTKSRQNKIQRLQAKIKEDVKGMDELTQERADLYRNIDQKEYELRQAQASLDALKASTACLEKDNNCLKEDLNKHTERNEGRLSLKKC